jgi:hypothetical protein
VRFGQLRIDRRARGSDDGRLVNAGSSPDGDRPEVEQRHGRAGRRLDRNRLPARRNRAGKGHDPRRRRENVLADPRQDVDATVLPRSVRMVAVEAEAASDAAVDRPGPRARRPDRKRERTEDQHAESPHSYLLVVRLANDLGR